MKNSSETWLYTVVTKNSSCTVCKSHTVTRFQMLEQNHDMRQAADNPSIAQLAIKHYMNTLPKDIAGFEVYHNPEVSPIRGDNYLFLAKNCQHFAKFFMGRMIEGKWTSEERIYDQNKGDWVENTINGGKKWVANKERDPSRFYLTEMARYIMPHVSISDTLAGMSKLGLQQKPVIDFGQVPGKLWADGLELLSRFAMYVFTSLEKIVARSAGTRRPETEVGNGRAHQD
jgi:hypothetical protein